MQHSSPGVPAKAWRWVAQMEEHGKAFASAGLTAEMMQGAAAFFAFVAKTPLGTRTPEDERLEMDTLWQPLADCLPKK